MDAGLLPAVNDARDTDSEDLSFDASRELHDLDPPLPGLGIRVHDGLADGTATGKGCGQGRQEQGAAQPAFANGMWRILFLSGRGSRASGLDGGRALHMDVHPPTASLDRDQICDVGCGEDASARDGSRAHVSLGTPRSKRGRPTERSPRQAQEQIRHVIAILSGVIISSVRMSRAA